MSLSAYPHYKDNGVEWLGRCRGIGMPTSTAHEQRAYGMSAATSVVRDLQEIRF